MKRVTVVMVASDRERSLTALQDLGVLHVSAAEAPQAGAPADENGVANARERLDETRRALAVLKAQPRARAGKAPDAAPRALVERTLHHAERIQDIDEEAGEIRRELERVAPLGEFDPDAFERLSSRDVEVRLVRAPARAALPTAEDVAVQEVGRDRQHRYLALVGRGAALAASALEQQDAAGFEPFPLPDRSPAAMRSRLDTLRSQRERETAALAGLAERAEAVEELVPRVEDRLAFEEARAAMATAGPLAFLRGYCPEPRLAAVRSAAEANGWGLLVEDVENPSEAPVLIRIPRWVRPIQALFSFTGVLPGYDQVDVSVPFLLFMSLFFAMIVGDAGYGLIFLALTEVMRWRMPRAPKAMFSFLRLMSVCTVIWGVLTGTYFGIGLLPHPLKAVQVSWLTDSSHMILLSFLIGAIHLSVAHGWNVVRFFPSPRALAQLGWIGTTWTMYFLATQMVLGKPFPHVMYYVLAAGVVLIVLFMTPPKALKSEWFNHVMLPLSLVSNFVDLVSYVRLFAVGAATFAIAEAFNQMAVGSGPVSFEADLVAALVLFFGHTLNILLASMGVLVHGVRLNMLEFASHLGMEWTGRPYRPFARSSHRQEGA